MTDPDRDSYESYLYALRCLRVQFEAGEKLTIREMLERADQYVASTKAPARTAGKGA